MSGYAVAALVALAVLGVVAVVLARRGVRRLRSRVAGWTTRAYVLRSRLLPPGPRRDAVALRIRLDSELRCTRDMLESAPQGVIFRADAAAVLQELATTAIALDTELAAIERFLDPSQQRAALATVAPQVGQLIETSYTARQTILRTAVEDRSRQLESLQASVASQAAALEAYRRGRRDLNI